MRLLVLLLSGCFFEPARPAPRDAASDAPIVNANHMFVMSDTIVPASLGNLAAADAACQSAALDAGLPDENYIAWLSSSSVDAITRVQGRGWKRRDERPVAYTKADFETGHLLYPPRLDERGNSVPENTVVVTATNGVGQHTADTCNDFNGGGTVLIGVPDGTGGEWTAATTLDCTLPLHLYCLGNDRKVDIPPLILEGRIGFVTTDPIAIGDGHSVTELDTFCASQAAGRSGSFKAFVAVGVNPPNTRFDHSKGAWHRLDGVEFAQQDLLGFDAPLHQDGHGDYIERDVWFGSSGPSAIANGNCVDWSQSGASSSTGDSARSSTGAYTGQQLLACGNGAHLYCLED